MTAAGAASDRGTDADRGGGTGHEGQALRRLSGATAIHVPVAIAAILGWLFAEWLIVGPCGGLTGCPSRSWGGHYVPLQAALAAGGVGAALWTIARALEGRPAWPALGLLVACAALWAIVVWVHARG